MWTIERGSFALLCTSPGSTLTQKDNIPLEPCSRQRWRCSKSKRCSGGDATGTGTQSAQPNALLLTCAYICEGKERECGGDLTPDFRIVF